MAESPKHPALSLVLACYNEMEHLESSLKAIEDYLAFVFPAGDYEVILVDDGSKDGTREFLAKLPRNEKRVVELNARNLGRGGAVKRGLELARGEISGFMDVDREVSEAYIPWFVKRVREGADLVVAYRVYKVSMSLHVLVRHFASIGYRALIRQLLGKPAVADSEAGYKFFSRRARDLILKDSRFDNWFWDTEVPELCAMRGLSVAELPVLFIRNPMKTSTVRLIPDILQYLKAVRAFRAMVSAGKYSEGAAR